jgi:hypothetical protein
MSTDVPVPLKPVHLCDSVIRHRHHNIDVSGFTVKQAQVLTVRCVDLPLCIVRT